jgi:hypothetical protein
VTTTKQEDDDELFVCLERRSGRGPHPHLRDKLAAQTPKNIAVWLAIDIGEKERSFRSLR